MSDLDESGVTYTDISSPFEELSDIGSPRADDHEHLMLPEMLEDPYVEDDKDDEDDDMDIEADEEEEKEEHPAPPDSVVVAPTTADQAPSAEETEPFETDESAATPPLHPAYRMTARISIPAPVPMPAWTHSDDRPEVTLPPRKRLDIALGPRYEVEESSSAAVAKPSRGLRADYGFVATVDREIMRDPEREVGYGITDSLDEIVETLQGAPVSIDTELGGYTERQLLAGQLNMLFRDRRAHAYTRHLMETEARMSREAWVRATYASDLVYSEVMSLRTTVLGQMSKIRELQAADRRRQTVISKLLRIDHRRSTEISELRTALQGQKQMALRRTTRSTTDQETINATSVTNAQLQAMIDQGVTAALEARDALRSKNGDDSHNSGTCGIARALAARDADRNMNGDDSHNSRTSTEGVVELTQWFENIETVFRISNCSMENQIKFSTCTLLGSALTWWNSHIMTVGLDAAYAMTWVDMKNKMTGKYCPRGEMKKLKNKIERYVGGLPDVIHGSVVESRPKTMQKAIEMANELIDKRNNRWVKRQAENKRKVDDTFRSN
nr:hypothetical protein [Tanacetum cinerariifolium]